MNHMIPAIFESGVFRPLEPVELAEGTRVQVQVPVGADVSSSSRADKGVAAWPAGYFEQTAGALEGEQFERKKGISPIRSLLDLSPFFFPLKQFITAANRSDPFPTLCLLQAMGNIEHDAS